MTSSPSSMITPLPRRGESPRDGDSGDSESLAALREELRSISKMVGELTTRAAERAEQLARGGTQQVRSQIEARPWTSMAIAAAAGAVIAVAIVPKRAHGFRYNDRKTYNFDDVSATLRNAVPSGVSNSLAARLEQVVDSINRIDPSTVAASPVFDTVKNWAQSVFGSLRKPSS